MVETCTARVYGTHTLPLTPIDVADPKFREEIQRTPWLFNGDYSGADEWLSAIGQVRRRSSNAQPRPIPAIVTTTRLA